MDTKKLGRIERPSHRVTGDRRDSVEGAGWEVAHVAIDDHSRAGFVQMHADEQKTSAVAFLKAAVAHYAALGVRIQRVLTDNGSAYRSRLFDQTCQALGIKHSFTRPYRPQTNGKAERFIQTCLREWAYVRSYANSAERTAWLPSFLAYYNSRRPHSALDYKPPASRLGGNNLLQLNNYALSAEQRYAINRGNAARLFPRSPRLVDDGCYGRIWLSHLSCAPEGDRLAVRCVERSSERLRPSSLPASNNMYEANHLTAVGFSNSRRRFR